MTYTGEIYHTMTHEPRLLMAMQVGRNYIFGLTDLIELDANSIGNESRFINDRRIKGTKSNLAKYNCGAERLLSYALIRKMCY
jgi:hypothetical protein